jgi:hypothetical protein
MSQALADLLIELADPTKLREYELTPERVMSEANLTPADKAAIQSRKSAWIRYQAKTDDLSTEYSSVKHPQIIAGLALDVIDVIDVVDVVAVAEASSSNVYQSEDGFQYVLAQTEPKRHA